MSTFSEVEGSTPQDVLLNIYPRQRLLYLHSMCQVEETWLG